MVGLIIALLIAVNVCLWIELKFKGRYKNALIEISKMGAGCDDCELYSPRSCRHASSAVLVALNALRNT